MNPEAEHALRTVADAIRGTPWEGHVWLVGGAVRDDLLGRPAPPDLDLMVEVDAPGLGQHLHRTGASCLAPVIYARFGTALVRVAGVSIELATARKDSYRDGTRKPDVQPATLHEDAQRRDFTINALLRSVETGEVFDPLGTGLADLRQGILRTPREPRRTFEEDPLRMLRAVRFRARLGFRYAEGLEDAIRAHVHDLDRISTERIRDEFVKTLVSDAPDVGLNDLKEFGLLQRFLPELMDLVGVEQGSYHHLDVWDHTLLVVKGLAPLRDPVLSLAGLFHDIAKPATRSVDAEGRTHFYEHERVGAKLAYGILQRLKFSNETAVTVALLVRQHMRLASVTRFSLPAARRLVRDLEGETDRYFALIEADLAALKPGAKPMDLAGIRETVDRARSESGADRWESPLNGEEIGELLGLEPGPRIGEAKRWLAELVLDGRLAPDDRERAAHLLRERFTRGC